MPKIKKSYIILIVFVGIVLIIASLYGTFAYNSRVEQAEDSYTILLTDSSNEVTLPGNSGMTVLYRITNTNKGKVSYGIAYSGVGDISVKAYKESYENIKGVFDYGENRTVKLYIENNSRDSNTVIISTVLGYENGGDLVVPEGYTLVNEIYKNLTGAAKYITDLYSNEYKSIIINNDIEYNYAEEVSLMNDRLGGTAGLDEGNVRYYGENPNNYIYFNCDDYTNQSADTCELWRIIGVFDGKVKIVRNEPIISYNDWYEFFYDEYNDCAFEDPNANISNDWYTSSLQAMLNGAYLNGEDTTYCDTDASKKDISFKEYGIKNDDTRNKIAFAEWNLGGVDYNLLNDNLIYPDQMYSYERGNNKCDDCTYSETWNGNIALMYPSDYLYASDFNNCDATEDYSEYYCFKKNWLTTITYDGNGTAPYIWLLTPGSNDHFSITELNLENNFFHDRVVVMAPINFHVETSYVDISAGVAAVYPTLYLNSSVMIKHNEYYFGIDGTYDNPYQIQVN